MVKIFYSSVFYDEFEICLQLSVILILFVSIIQKFERYADVLVESENSGGE